MTRYSLAQLEQLSREALVAEYDREAEHVELPLTFLREELFRRDMQKQNQRIESMTKEIKRLTSFIAFLTSVSTVAVLVEVLRRY